MLVSFSLLCLPCFSLQRHPPPLEAQSAPRGDAKPWNVPLLSSGITPLGGAPWPSSQGNLSATFQPPDAPCPPESLPTPEGMTANIACLPVVDRSAEFPELTVREGSVGHPDVIIPNPGRIEAGTTYKSGRLPVTNSATYRTYLEVYPQSAGTMQPNSFALATATNRVEKGVEVLAYYTTGPNGPDVPLLRVFDWSCLPAYPCANGATSPAYTWTVQIRDVTCYYKMLEDNTGHYVNYVYYRNSSWMIDPGVPPSTPPLWRNAVTFLNFCTSQYDGVYDHDYRHNQQDCSVTGCKSWAGIVEVDDNLPPAENIAKQGFHHQALDYDGQTSYFFPEDVNFISPPTQWQMYYLLPNNTYETGTYQDDDGDGVPNSSDHDIDGDGVNNGVIPSNNNNETQCGATASSGEQPEFNPYVRPERIDGVFAGVDDDGDTLVDEALPAGAASRDCDGDGYNGGPEGGTPLCGNGVNDDGVIYGGSDDSVVDDGCPGGPSQVGAYSEGQFNIGVSDQDACGTNGWPSDLVSGGVPDSTNKINILDWTSLQLRMNTSPGNPSYNSRWDLQPGPGVFSNWINVSDLTTLIAGASGYPPMLNEQKAFNGPSCPWPP